MRLDSVCGKIRVRMLLKRIILGIALLAMVMPLMARTPASAAIAPNIVDIVFDDVRSTDWVALPSTRALLSDLSAKATKTPAFNHLQAEGSSQVRSLPYLTRREIRDLNRRERQRLHSLAAADEMVLAIWNTRGADWLSIEWANGRKEYHDPLRSPMSW